MNAFPTHRGVGLPVFSVFLALITWTAGCNKDSAANADCTDNSDCDDMQICQADSCLDVECMSSADCQINQYCDTQNTPYTCIEGCAEDADCYAGEACNTETNSCERYGCRSTELDCAIGQYCDIESGLCYDATGEGHCASCEIDAQNRDNCAEGASCWLFDSDGSFCFSTNDCQPGWFCYAFSCYLGYCLVDCDPGQEVDACPRGYSCTESSGQFVCFSDCQWLEENGYLD